MVDGNLISVENLYSLKFQKFIKVLSIVAIILLCFSNIIKFYSLFFLKQSENIFLTKIYIILNFITIFLCVILFFNPVKFELISICTFLYSSISIFYEIENLMGILMFFFGTSIIAYRGFFKTNKTKKVIIICLVFLSLLLSEIRFGFHYFIEATIYKVGLLFIIIGIFFFLLFLFSETKKTELNKTLDLSIYPNLTLRDTLWLKDIINKKAYKEIAYENNMTVGSVKNRLKIIFSTLQVGDKTGFLNRYSDYSIIFNQ